MIFEVFENTSEKFRYFFMESSLIARSYRVQLINIKILIMGALVTLETQLKVPILVVFWRYLAFFELFLLEKAFSLANWFITKNLFNVLTFTCSKRFFIISSWDNNQYNVDQIFVWSLKSAVSGCTHQDDLKLGQCLDVDGTTSSCKFGEVTLLSSHFVDQHLAPF